MVLAVWKTIIISVCASLVALSFGASVQLICRNVLFCYSVSGEEVA